MGSALQRLLGRAPARIERCVGRFTATPGAVPIEELQLLAPCQQCVRRIVGGVVWIGPPVLALDATRCDKRVPQTGSE